MNVVFADTTFYIAAANSRDSLHRAAIDFVDPFDGLFVTTEFVLLEVGTFLNRIGRRQIFVDLIRDLRVSPDTEIVPASTALFERGLTTFESRMDKEWSLTDCTSLVVMSEREILDALTEDRHFAQAGFRPLLLPGN